MGILQSEYLSPILQDIRFTIATTTGRVSTPRNPYQIGYTFSLYGKQYKSAAAFASQHLRFLNGRYFVRVPGKSPGASEILWNTPVPDSLNAPENGWPQIPVPTGKITGDPAAEPAADPAPVP